MSDINKYSPIKNSMSLYEDRIVGLQAGVYENTCLHLFGVTHFYEIKEM